MRYKSAMEMPHCSNKHTHTHSQRPQTHSQAGVTTASFDLLTLRLLKQALRQLFCKICLPRKRERERERERRGEGERERVKVCMRCTDIAGINTATLSILPNL